MDRALGAVHTDLSIRKLNGGKPAGESFDELRITRTQEGFLDDSVDGERRHYVLKRVAPAEASSAEGCAEWELVSASVEWKCYRGKLRGRWVSELCP